MCRKSMIMIQVCVDVPAALHVCQCIVSSPLHSSSLGLHYPPGFALSPGPDDSTVLILTLSESMHLQQGEFMSRSKLGPNAEFNDAR